MSGKTQLVRDRKCQKINDFLPLNPLAGKRFRCKERKKEKKRYFIPFPKIANKISGKRYFCWFPYVGGK